MILTKKNISMAGISSLKNIQDNEIFLKNITNVNFKIFV